MADQASTKGQVRATADKQKAPAPAPHALQAVTVPAIPLPAVQRAIDRPSRASPADILALQRVAGNRAVSRLLTNAAARPPSPGIQAKLTVGPAGDRYEQEADRVAEQVVSGQQSAVSHQRSDVQRQEDEEEVQTKPLAASITPLVQRQVEEEEIQTKAEIGKSFDAGPEIEDRLAAHKGGGSPLPGEVRAYMEPRFGADFSGVKVHTGADAAGLNRQIQAQAFTHGQDIYLGAGRYEPGTDAGKRLLAHELTHVVQQTGGGGQRPVQKVSRLPGVQRELIQRDIPSPYEWKEMSKLDWKRRSTEVKQIDKALAEWHTQKNSRNSATKLAAINKLWYAIQSWQAQKKEGGVKAKRDPAIVVLQEEVRQVRDTLQPHDDVATLTLNVDVESDDPHNRTLWELMHSKVGHAWMTLEYDAPDATGNRTFNLRGFNGPNLDALEAGRPKKAAFGFYPINFRSDPEETRRYYGRVNMATMGKSTLVQPDTRHQAKAQKHYRVNDDAVKRIGDFVQDSKGHDYSLTGYNCVSFSRGVIEVAGHMPPPSKRMRMDQANKVYRSVVRLGKAGDRTIDDRVEQVQNIVADPNKTYANLTDEEAKALALVMRDHKKVCKEAGLLDVDSQVLPVLRQDWQALLPAQRTQVLDPATRKNVLAGKLATHGRLLSLQMAAVLMDEEGFGSWMEADKIPVQGELVNAMAQDLAKNYQNISKTEAEALMQVTFKLPEVRDTLGIFNNDDLVNDMYRMYYAKRDESDQFDDPRTGWPPSAAGFRPRVSMKALRSGG